MDFVNPPKRYYPVPFFFLNSDLDEKDIELFLKELRNKHIYGVFLHPRTGLEVEYLTNLYWEKIRFIINKINELGMTAWLYDEYNWPSGAAGGKFLRKYPQYRQIYLDYAIRKAVKGKEVGFTAPGGIISAVAVRKGSEEKMDLNEHVSDRIFYWTPSEGKWDVIIFFEGVNDEVYFNTTCAPWVRGEEGYLDILNPDAVKKFIELTHEEYAKRFKECFGKTILGIFTDEPANYKGLPWTGNFFEKFKEKKGYDLQPKLHELALDIGDYARTRCDYHDVVLELYEEAFFKQMKEWCEKNDLRFTGHLFMEEMLLSLPATQGAFFPLLRNMHIPGIDYLSDKTGYDPIPLNDVWGSNLAAKSLSSTAHAIGAKRTLCEIFGGCGWKTTLANLLNVINWATACGINLVNPHACHLSLKGLRKRDFPASHFAQEPWWKYYDKFADYVARVSYLSTLGKHVADVALLYPMRTFWAEHTLHGISDRLRFIKESFLAIANALLRIQRDYDFVFEESVIEGTVKVNKDCLEINGERYKVLILPPATIVPKAVARLTQAFFEEGGKIIAVGFLPKGSDEKGEDSEVIETIRRVFKTERGPGEDLPHGPSWTVNQNKNGGKAIFIPLEKIPHMEEAESLLRKALDECIPRDISIETPESRNFIYLHRTLEGKDLYFVANLSDKKIDATVILNVLGCVEKLDPMTGSVVPVTVYHIVEGKTVIPYNFEKHQALWFMITRDKKQFPHVEGTNITVTSVKSQRGKLFVEGFSRALEPYVDIDGKRIEVSTEDILDEIVLPSVWEIVIPEKNIAMIEPWTVKLVDAAWKAPLSDQQEDISEFLPVRTRFILKLMRLIVKIKEVFSRGRKTFPISRYTPLEDLYADLMRIAERFGIKWRELGIYETMRIIAKAATDAGLLPPSIPLGSRYIMDSTVNVEYLPKGIELVYEDLGEPVEIYVNNIRVTEVPKEEFVWDVCNRVVSVEKYLRVGKNSIRIHSRMPSFMDKSPSAHGVEPVALRGAFMVRNKCIVEPVSMVEAEDWRNIGFPNYSGKITYRQSFTLPEEYSKRRLFLEFSQVKETVEVWINRRKVGERIAEPYTLDITDFVVPGENKLEVKVTNTAENMLGTAIPAGILGKASIIPYNKHSLTLESVT